MAPRPAAALLASLLLPWAAAAPLPDPLGLACDAAAGLLPACQAWATLYSGPGLTGPDSAEALAASADGSFVVMAGPSPGLDPRGDQDVAVVALEAADGHQRWAARYDEGTVDNAEGVAVSPDGSLVLAAGWTGPGANQDADMLALALDAGTGQLRWAVRFDGGVQGDDFAWHVRVAPDGGTAYVVGGATFSAGRVLDVAVLALDTATGAQRWLARYDDPGDGPYPPNDFANEAALSPDGATLYVTGHSYGTDIEDTLALDAATGALRWATRTPAPALAFTDDLAVSPDGGLVLVAGSSTQGSPRYDYEVRALHSADGSLAWRAGYNGTGTVTSQDYANALAASPDSRHVYVTGDSRAADALVVHVTPGLTLTPLGADHDFATLALDAATGAREWLARYDGPAAAGSDDHANGLALSPDGSVLVAVGTSANEADDFDILTVAYDAATGQQLRAWRYNGPGLGNDYGHAVRVLPGGRVVVAGIAEGLGASGEDMAAVAYDLPQRN
jgi:sugar lactone lactonase YvrE